MSVATRVTARATHVAQQLPGADVRKLGDPTPVGAASGPVEIGQAVHGATPSEHQPRIRDLAARVTHVHPAPTDHPINARKPASQPASHAAEVNSNCSWWAKGDLNPHVPKDTGT